MAKTGAGGTVEMTKTGKAGAHNDDALAWLATRPDLRHGPKGEWRTIDERRILAHGPPLFDAVCQARA